MGIGLQQLRILLAHQKINFRSGIKRSQLAQQRGGEQNIPDGAHADDEDFVDRGVKLDLHEIG